MDKKMQEYLDKLVGEHKTILEKLVEIEKIMKEK